ncbi:hypothetical protein [Micropruina sp.]|uniref:hypothetical protein n=1 Tax=Micropruina sp. TaxID=2737536 RepID=UPI00260BD26B|nr:hypothetical protein [Micropruina sp.]
MSAAPTPTPTGQVAVSARRDDRTAAAIMAGIAVIAGIAGAVLWRLVVRLPAYVVQPDGSATVSERALTEFFAGDAWYTVIGVVVGAGLGIATWRRFKGIGWPCAFLAAGLGLLAGLVCWQLGEILGGVPFDERLAAAKPGDTVPIALALRSPSALAVWAFAAVTPILLGSALGPDEEAAPRQPRRRRRQVPSKQAEQREVVDDLGVVRTEENASNQ